MLLHSWGNLAAGGCIPSFFGAIPSLNGSPSSRWNAPCAMAVLKPLVLRPAMTSQLVVLGGASWAGARMCSRKLVARSS